ncbi:MAG: hypothetical protein J6M18_03530 [Actinomycetaceae bacterium]|nr:hypothetical protein [Actinomycetaceae bacterium]
MSKFSVIVKIAKKIGPAVVLTAMRYGPRIRRVIEENPQSFNGMITMLQRVSNSMNGKGKSEDLLGRCAILRDQVTYLYASANTSDVANKASQWREELEKIEHTIPLLDAMSRKERNSQHRRLVRKIDHISSLIVSASIIDDVEDAEYEFIEHKNAQTNKDS